MKKLLFSLTVISLFLASCQMVDGKRVRGDGNIIKENRKIRPFRDLDVSGNIEIRLTQDSVTSLVIETDDNLRPFISVRQEGDKLKVDTRRGYSLRPSHKLIIYISNSGFRDIHVSGASTIVGKNKIGNGSPLSFDLSGASELDMDVKAERIDLEASGACQIRLRGEARDVKIDGEGATEIRCFDLMTENTEIGISGAGSAEVFASVTLKAHISGAAEIRYKGNAEVTKEISGAGSIKKE
jgi:hypothetical protein